MSLPQHSIYRSPNVDLNGYVVRDLQPTAEFNSRCNRATDELARFLKEQCRTFRVAETIKGGSLGKGTHIRGHCDLDLVMLLDGYPTVHSFKEALPRILRDLRDNVRRWECANFNVADLVTTDRTICITMNTSYEGQMFRLRVDVVPAFARRDASVIFREMQHLSEEDRSYYRSSLAKLQIDFVANRPASLKNLIRLVKDWRKTHLRKNVNGLAKIPKSYALELVTIHVWEQASSPPSFPLDQLLKRVLIALSNPASISKRWPKYYQAPQTGPTSGKPFLLDPADPFHDVGSDFDWTEMAAMARATANSPRLIHIAA